MADIDIASVYDEVSVSESTTLSLSDIAVSTYEVISVAETKTANIHIHWRSGTIKLPVWELSSAFASTLQLSANIPPWQLTSVTTEDPKIKVSRFAMRLVGERLGLLELSSTMSSVAQLTLSKNIPVGRVSGTFGSRLSKKISVCSLDGTLLVAKTMQLDKYIPLRTASGSMYEEGTLQLDTYSIPWEFDGSIIVSEDKISIESKIPGAFISSITMHEEIAFNLDSNIPPRTLSGELVSDIIKMDSNIPGAFFLTGMLGTDYYLSLDTNIPPRTLAGVLYCKTNAVESYMPVWRMSSVGGASMTETEVATGADSDFTGKSFSGVLRYIRP